MALHKNSKVKLFRVHYCGCTTASSLFNEPKLVDGIFRVREKKSEKDFVRTTISISTDGVRLNYDKTNQNSIEVPSSMVAGSTIGKSPFDETVGVVYISPLTGEHFPAFVHVYRCENVRIAQKLLQSFRSFFLIENHRVRLIRLEKEFFVKAFDPIRAVTQELRDKIRSDKPILFPPKDYDTLHEKHGHVQRAQQWKSTEPTIVGYSPIRPSKTVETTTDPVETVSLAFDFLKDETGSIANENEKVQTKPTNNDVFIYRFRPSQATAISSNWLVRKQNPPALNNEGRARPEVRLLDDYQPAFHLRNPFNNGFAFSTNPLWNGGPTKSQSPVRRAQYLDTREFILRPSTEQNWKNEKILDERHDSTTTNRPFSTNFTNMLDVYY